MRPEKLIVFVKAPRPGQVKTRLAETLGAEAACAAYRRLVETQLQQLSSLPEVELRFAPDDAVAEIQPWLRPSWRARPQGDGDLGRRLRSAFAEAFAAGNKAVVIVGSDCPEVAAADIREAWRELRTFDLVLRQPQAALFEGIRWSSEFVLAETLARARARGQRIQLLRILTDVDTAKEWGDFLAAQKASLPAKD